MAEQAFVGNGGIVVSALLSVGSRRRSWSSPSAAGGEGDGEALREDDAAAGSEQEHGVVHVPRRVDDLHPHPVLRLDCRPVGGRVLAGDGLDDRQPLPLRGDLSLFPLEEGNPFRRGSGGVQCVDLVGTDGQWQAADPEQEVFDRRASYSVPDGLSHHRLSAADALPQQPCSLRSGCR